MISACNNRLLFSSSMILMLFVSVFWHLLVSYLILLSYISISLCKDTIFTLLVVDEDIVVLIVDISLYKFYLSLTNIWIRLSLLRLYSLSCVIDKFKVWIYEEFYDLLWTFNYEFSEVKWLIVTSRFFISFFNWILLCFNTLLSSFSLLTVGSFRCCVGFPGFWDRSRSF